MAKVRDRFKMGPSKQDLTKLGPSKSRVKIRVKFWVRVRITGLTSRWLGAITYNAPSILSNF